ncbi:MAG: DNA-directed RNA polymerase subunit alpha [Candidatus Firestonebacteria bacterium]|nr:DNA-directed RNA polymerase subunit alpha [Candidatus Firestonebacteria bacterium]
MEMPKSMEIDSSTLTGVYGKFIAEPFERGYGQTVGTAIRRVLLSSIQAAAITSIKIENVLHEFGTIKGVAEDVTHIDSIFTPVTRVNYTVESTRVGQQINYEKLILEIWTDGRIKPEEALSYSAKIMKEHLSVFIRNEDDLIMEDESSVDEKSVEIEEILKKSVDELELSVRSANCLKLAGINTIDELVKKSESEMLKYRNFGKKSLKEINDILKTMGLDFNMDINSPDIPDDCELPGDITPIYVEKEKKPKKK